MDRSLLWSVFALGCAGALSAAPICRAASAAGRARATAATTPVSDVIAWPYWTTAALLPVLVFLATLPSRPPFAPGQGLGKGFLLGGALALLAGWMAVQAARADSGEGRHPMLGAALVTGPQFLALISAAAPLLWLTDVAIDALVGAAVGWFTVAVVLYFGLNASAAQSQESGLARSAALALAASSGFAVTVCAAAALGVFRGEDDIATWRWAASALVLSAAVPLTVFLCSIPAYYLARIGVKLPLARLFTGVSERLTADEAARRTLARGWRALIAAALVVGIARLVQWKTLVQPHVFQLVLIGVVAGAMVWWLGADDARTDDSPNAANRALCRTPLAGLLVLAAVIVAFTWLAGYGVALVLLGAWLCASLAVVSAAERAQEPELADAVLRSGTDAAAQSTVVVLMAGVVLLLYRLVAQRFGDSLRAPNASDYYTIMAFLIGAVLPSVLTALPPQGRRAPVALQICALCVAGAITLAAPAITIVLWKSKAVLALVTGLSVSAILRAGDGRNDRYDVAAPMHGVTTALFALGVALALAQFTGHALALDSLSRHEKTIVLRWIVGAVVALIAAVEVADRVGTGRASRADASAVQAAAAAGGLRQ